MTQKEIKEQLKLLPRFIAVCCSKMCYNHEECKLKEDESLLSCPWFFGYRMTGWPVRHLSDYSYDAPKLPDLRIEEVTEDFLIEWRNRRSKQVVENEDTKKKITKTKKTKK